MRAAATDLILPEFVRYAGAGAFGTVAHYALLFALVEFARLGTVTASTAGAMLGALVNYGVNYRYTFASARAHRVALPRFASALLGALNRSDPRVIVIELSRNFGKEIALTTGLECARGDAVVTSTTHEPIFSRCASGTSERYPSRHARGSRAWATTQATACCARSRAERRFRRLPACRGRRRASPRGQPSSVRDAAGHRPRR